MNYVDSLATQASSAYNGVAIVKLMGRQSGFIAMYATLASGQVDIVLIPEVYIYSSWTLNKSIATFNMTMILRASSLFKFVENKGKANVNVL